jgi:hypothetical protein
MRVLWTCTVLLVAVNVAGCRAYAVPAATPSSEVSLLPSPRPSVTALPAATRGTSATTPPSRTPRPNATATDTATLEPSPSVTAVP